VPINVEKDRTHTNRKGEGALGAGQTRIPDTESAARNMYGSLSGGGAKRRTIRKGEKDHEKEQILKGEDSSEGATHGSAGTTQNRSKP